MDKLTHYRSLIKQLLTDRANLMRSQPLPGEEVLCLLEENTDNYLLLRVGWLRGERLYSPTLHIRIIDHKIQIEQDWTDDFVADLIAAGIPRTDIVFAFTPPELRSLPDYAVA